MLTNLLFKTNLTFLLGAICLVVISCGRNPPLFLDSGSSQIKNLLENNPSLMREYTSIANKYFHNKAFQIQYVENKNQDQAPAYHYYTTFQDKTVVVVVLRGRKIPIDEFICLLFEMINSNGEDVFKKITIEAQSGLISRDDFPVKVLEKEFAAVLELKKILLSLEIDKEMLKDSAFYYKFMNSPDDFAKFLDYIKDKNITHRDIVDSYLKQYDRFIRNRD